MAKGTTKVVAMLMAVMMLVSFHMAYASGEQPAAQEKPYNELAAEVDDASDLPSWEGKQLTLRYWAGHGSGGIRNYNRMSNDVVTPEIQRVTGITIDEDNSYDNGSGQTFSQKLALVVAAKDYPEIVTNVDG